MNAENNGYRVPAETRIGHVHLKVSDLERSLDFYCGLLGFELVTRYGSEAAFVSAGGYHHHIGLNVWESKNASPPPRHSTGLYHVAILYPSRRDLAEMVVRLQKHNQPFGASDHGVSEAIYLNDPDYNGLELYCDRPRSEWPLAEDGTVDMYTKHLDLDNLLGVLNNNP